MFSKNNLPLKETAMVIEIITIFLFCDEYLKAIGYKDNHQVIMSTSEVLTTAIVAAKFFGGNYEKSRHFLEEHYYIKNMLSKSRFIRRLNRIDNNIFNALLQIMAKAFKETSLDNEFLIDSFPVPVCLNIRMERSKIYPNQEYKGYNAAKEMYFLGIKVHMVVTKDRKPIEFFITPGSCSDIKAAKKMKLNLTPQSILHGDKGYTDYKWEDHLEFTKQIFLSVPRKKNSKRKEKKTNSKARKGIETSFSEITAHFPKKIHAVTARGFVLKVIMFIFAYTFKFW